ncbi:protein-L-isoaspartate O-methyltransferase family protein [Streptomyces sp. 3211]|uniref:protein-L-isoaspartate O-methyltransferase family protein n=1 Tax=Streptomyces sp. 3211 TaxID=1964449 RepID=UPI0017FB1365|nr:methyltransferase domain-containing protein [Streptomyces sp. 3211]
MPTTPADAPAADVLVDGLLAAVAKQLGQPLPAPLQEAFHRVPRHRFLPDRIWLRDGSGGYRPVDRATEPDGWLAAAYSDQPLVTRFTDDLPSSSASMVARMLLLAGLAEPHAANDARARVRVLELGAGTGFNAGLLCALVGDEQVTTVDLDPTLATDARENLKTVGCAPMVVAADGALGWQPNAPYDVVLGTFSVDRIPSAWLTQLRVGGRIVTPWTSAWCSFGTLTLTATGDGEARGRFYAFASFMQMARPGADPDQRPAAPEVAAGAASYSSTGLSQWAVAGGDLDAEFHIGLTASGASFAWDISGGHAHTRLQIRDPATGSWAAVDYDGRTASDFAVTQAGSRQLWDEITAAYRRWEELGRPSVDRYGLTVTSGGTAVWVDSPATRVAAAR